MTQEEEVFAMFVLRKTSEQMRSGDKPIFNSSIPRTQIAGKVSMCEIDLDVASRQSWKEIVIKQRDIRRRSVLNLER